MWHPQVKYQCSYMTFFLSIIFFTLRIINIDAAREILCPALEVPKNGYFLSNHCERQPGSLCGIRCLIGYHAVDGDTFRECQQNGVWTGQQLRCEEIRCAPFKLNSQVAHECTPEQNGNNFKVGTKCRATCSQVGYRLIGPSIRKCLILGIWSGYEQFCIVDNETTETIAMTTTTTTTIISEQLSTTTDKSKDYSNFALNIHKNDTGINLPFSQPLQFTIIFWFYLNDGSNASLVSLKGNNNKSQFEIVVRDDRLAFYYLSRNQTQPTSIKVSLSKWNHFAWVYSNTSQLSYLYIDGSRQQSFDFKIINLNFENISSLILFHPIFIGLTTRLEIWNEMLTEQKILISYRDCRKQNGDIFSWSKIPDQISFDTNKLKASSFCTGCSEPASIPGGIYDISDYEVGSSVEYKCNYGYEMIGSDRIYCMVPSQWYPLPPICKYNPCTTDCALCDKNIGVCLRQFIPQAISTTDCNEPCDDDEECIDGECTWSNAGDNWMSVPENNACNPQCSSGTQCINRRCEPNMASSCSVSCRSDQLCIANRCGCYKGLCETGRDCYEICEIGERCYNQSCSCGFQGKCKKGEICLLDVCMCGTKRGGCESHEYCVGGKCICKTNQCGQCNDTCKSNEICLDGKCICREQCGKTFCPFPCMNGGRCTGFYQCTCQQGWSGYRCEQRQRKNITVS